MSEATPEEFGIENEAICETLLRWKRSSILGYWFPSHEHAGTVRTPSFATWAEAGLILEALQKKGTRTELLDWGNCWECRIIGNYGIGLYDTGPLAIRAAALEYLKAVKS